MERYEKGGDFVRIFLESGDPFIWQWDTKHRVLLTDFPSGTEVHFSNRASEEAPVVLSYADGEKIVADIPVFLMQEALDITVYACDQYNTRHCTYISVIERAKPGDYVYEEVEIIRYAELAKRIPFDPTYEGQLLYVVDGIARPLKLGPGLSIKDGRLVNVPDSGQNVIDEVIIPSQTIEVDLLPLSPAENKVMSTSGDNIVFYNNDGWRTVFIPVESSKTYRLVYIGSQYTTFRHAFLDENKTGLAVDYHLAENVTNEQPVIFTAKNNGYYAVGIQAPDYGTGSIQFLTEVETEETIERVLSSNVKLAAEHVAQVINDGLRVSNVAGKKLGVIGDSITFGTVNLGETRLTENERWWGYVKARYGFAEVEWNAEVGRAFTRDGTMSTRFTQKIKELSGDLDVIIVFGGVNDRAFNANIGTIDDEPKEDDGGISFYSALRFTAEYLLTNHPNARIIYMSPLPCKQSFGFNGKNEAGYRVQDYADAISEMCRAYGFDFVDLNRVGGFYVWNQSWLDAHMEDGIHPNKAGTGIYVRNGILPKLDTIFFDR